MRFSLRDLLFCVAWFSLALAMMAPLLHVGPRARHTSTAEDMASAVGMLSYFFAGIPLAFGIVTLIGRYRLVCWTVPLLWPILGFILLVLLRSPIFLP